MTQDRGTNRSADNYATAIGFRAHKVVGCALAEGIPVNRTLQVHQTLGLSRDVLRTHPMGKRERAALMDICTTASTYLARFALPEGWSFVEAEVPLDGGRADLAFKSDADGRVLLDEIKTGRGRLNDASLREQIDRYLAAGITRWGSDFVGVRLCAVAQPTASRLYLPGGKRSQLLSQTSLMGLVRL